jgi:GT2 family glycosyltransferase
MTGPLTGASSLDGTPRVTPLISVVMPTYDPGEAHLRLAIESVRAQDYPHWELRIADDGSTRPTVRSVLEQYASADPRIEVEFLEANSGISAASNRALATCRGEYVGFLDHDDALTADALSEVAGAIAADPSVDAIYSDSDKLGAGGERVDPFLKPDWSPVYALGAMYIGHLLVVRRSVAEKAGGFDSRFDTIQDFEFFLRVSERTPRITHLARVLYHWRAIPGSIAAGAEQKSGVPALQAKAVSDHLRRRGIPATAAPHPEIPHRAQLVPDRRQTNPLVSLVMRSSGDGRRLRLCLDSLLEGSTYPRLEAVAAPGRTAPTALNSGIERASGEYLVLLEDDVETLDSDWIDRLLMYAELPAVGAVGPRLLYPDGRVRSAGIALGIGGTAGDIMRGFPGDGDGYYGSLPCAREVGAVSAACMLLSRSAFERVGGFAHDYRAEYHDVDLCLRLRAQGLEAVYAPLPRIVRHERLPPEANRDITDRALFVDTWYEVLQRGDPYYNPHLSRDDANYSLHQWPEDRPAADREAALAT